MRWRQKSWCPACILPVETWFWHPWILIIIDVAHQYCYKIKFVLHYSQLIRKTPKWLEAVCSFLPFYLWGLQFQKEVFLLGSRKCQTIVSIWHSKKHKQVLNCVDSTFFAINYLLTMSFSYSSVFFTSMFCLLFVFDNILQV